MPKTKLIIVTMNENSDVALQAMHIGASGYLLKSSLASELLSAIQAALKGSTYVTPQIARGMEDSFVQNPDPKQSRALTQRQREVLQLIAEGKSMKQAAAILDVTPRTIAFHKYRMMQEFHILTTAELVQFAIRHRVVILDSLPQTTEPPISLKPGGFCV
jgi:DNA-binding NarL/FixJ family response regulator